MATRMLQRRGTAAEWAALNPVLGDGEVGVERDTGIFKIGDGVTAYNSLLTLYKKYSDIETMAIPKSIVDASGDLIVGSAADTVVRLPKGTNGQQLKISSGGALAWEDVPVADLTTRVAKAGDTMTGDLTVSKADAALLLQETVTDRIQVKADTAQQYIQVDDELHVCGINSTIAATPKILRSGAMYDTGNRVYSLSNPPPGGNVIVPGYNAYVWNNAATDFLPLINGSIDSTRGMMNGVYQTASASTSAIAAGYVGLPRKGFNQATNGTIVFEGTVLRVGNQAVCFVGLVVLDSSNLDMAIQMVGFSIDASSGNVKAYSYTGASIYIGQINTNGTQRGSTQTEAIVASGRGYFKIEVTIAGVVTFTFNSIVIYTGNLSITLYDFVKKLGLIAHQVSSGASPGSLLNGHFLITYV